MHKFQHPIVVLLRLSCAEINVHFKHPVVVFLRLLLGGD
jgi:hypothetical protein